MGPRTTVIASGQFPKAFLFAIARAVAPLLVGIVCACIAGLLYAIFLASDKIGGFFSSAAGIATGVLIALIVNGLRRDDLDVDPSIRAGTVALAAIGLFSAMTGQLVTGSTVVRGFLFALAWGGLMAGVLGLVFFLRAQSEPRSKIEVNSEVDHLLGLTKPPTPRPD